MDRLGLSDYELRHLAAHLEASGRADQLHRLLAAEDAASPTDQPDNTWYREKLAVGDLGGYLDDVERAWRLARAGAADATGQARARLWALQARYALVAASLGSLAGAVPPTLLVRLVEAGIWGLERAIAAARRMPQAGRRAEALAGLARRFGSGEQRQRLRLEAVETADGIDDVYLRAVALAVVALALPADELHRLERPWRLGPRELERRYSTAAAGQATPADSLEAISPGRIPALLHEASRLPDEADVAARLIALAPQLKDETLDEALRITTGLAGEFQRTLAVTALVPRLVGCGRHADAEAAVRRLTPARAGEEGVDRIRSMLVGDAGHAGLRLRDAAAAVDDPYWRAELLTSTVGGDEEQETALREALSATGRLGDRAACDALAARIAVAVATLGDAAGALEIADTIVDPEGEVDVLGALAGRAAGELRATLACRARSLRDPYWRARALTVLASACEATPGAGPALGGSALAGSADRGSALAGSAGEAPSPASSASESAGSLRSEALRLVRTAVADDAAVELMLTLAAHAPDPDRARLVDEALDRAARVPNAYRRGRALAAVLDQAPDRVLGDALDHADRVLGDVLDQAPDGVLDHADRVLGGPHPHGLGVDGDDDAGLLTAAVLALAAERSADEALRQAGRITDPYARGAALRLLAGRLAATDPAGALAAARAAGPWLTTPELVGELAASLAAVHHPALVDLVADLPDPALRVTCAARLATASRGAARERAYGLALGDADDAARAEALTVLAVGDAGDAAERAALERSAASLADPGPRRLAEAAIALAGCVGDGHDLGDELLVSVPPVRRTALATAVAARVDGAPRGRLLAVAVEALGEVSDHHDRLDGLAMLAEHAGELDAATAGRCWAEALDAAHAGGREAVLDTVEALLPIGVILGGAPLLGQVGRAVHDVSRWWP